MLEQARQFWRRIPIRIKCVLLMGAPLAAVWTLAAAVMFHLQLFSWESEIIMGKYMDLSGFITAFSEENMGLEEFMRPTATAAARTEYLASIAKTNVGLYKIRPDAASDSRGEYALKRAIRNAMDHYRAFQQRVLNGEDEDQRIQDYLYLKKQAAYIDGYARDLLSGEMAQGNERWSNIAAANDASVRRIVLGIVCVSVLTVFLLTLFARSILCPVSGLGRAADAISTGCYDAPPLEVQSQDELGRTARSFNQMQEEIRRTIQALEKQSEMEKDLLKKEVEAAQMQRRLEERRFAQLQSQINPHFLFNTLNTIAALAQEENAPLSENMISRLSRFFRYSLESEETVVTLGQEIRLLRDYMELQEMRFGERIAMEVVSDPSLEGLHIPKFVLQPLVENAILHGLKECTGGGHIRVRTRRGRRGVTVTVTDNGCGFDVKHPASPKGRRSVGLENIRERMKYSGGRLDVFSIPGAGSCARITIGEEGAYD